MKELLYSMCVVLSFVLLVSFVAYFFKYRKKEHSKRKTPSFVIIVSGFFLATLLIFIPIYYFNYDFGDNYNFFRSLLLSVHNSLRVFILDGEFDIITNSIVDLPMSMRICYSVYCAVLYVIDPILTFGTVISMFKGFISELRYTFSRKSNIYVMSELNANSIALAKNIIKSFADKKPLIVFTDVFEADDEKSYELMLEAIDMRAICMKKDIAHLNITEKKGNIEIFLIGSDESENINQASMLTKSLNEFKKKTNIKVFVFANSIGSSHIIDSFTYTDELLDSAIKEDNSNPFKLRRVDIIQKLVWSTVPKMKLFEKSQDRTISVMIAGMGLYGTEFVKMLIWYCQVEGYHLELNIFDIKPTENVGSVSGIKSIFRRQCPEIVENENEYDIKFFGNVDFNSDTFYQMINGKDEIAKRLAKTTHAIVCLGGDDENIETAIYLRKMFDIVKNINAGRNISLEDENPFIYSVVYDNKKLRLFNNGGAGYLINYKEIPYNINFIGDIEQMFEYENIYDAKLEKSAFEYHIEWSKINQRINEENQENGQNGQNNLYTLNAEELNKEKKKYERFEYFRKSSLSKALHKGMLLNSELGKNLGFNNGHKQSCLCEVCERRKRIEHTRWNAYMRTEGFIYSGSTDGFSRSDRAMKHNDICGWDILPKDEKIKD